MKKNLAGLAFAATLFLSMPAWAQTELRPELPVPPEDQAVEAEEQKAVDKVTDAVLDPTGANKQTEPLTGAADSRKVKPTGENHAVVTGAAKTVGKSVGAVGHGAVTGVEAVGHGAVTGVEKVGHGAVTGVEKVGHGAVAGAEAVGHGAKVGVEKVGHGAVTGAEAVGHGAKVGVEKVGGGVEAVGHGAKVGVEKVGHGVGTVGRSTLKGAETLGSGAKKGVMGVGRTMGRGLSALKVWDRNDKPAETPAVDKGTTAPAVEKPVDESSAVPSKNKAVAEKSVDVDQEAFDIEKKPAASEPVPAASEPVPAVQPAAAIEAAPEPGAADAPIDSPKSWAD